MAAIFAMAGAASAQTTGIELAQAKNCLACHQIDAKRIGPPFRSVAQRYGAQEGMVDYLAGVVRQGGRGVWGVVPMPAQPRVTPAEAKALVEWILSLNSQVKP
jgi:cytochrome c